MCLWQIHTFRLLILTLAMAMLLTGCGGISRGQDAALLLADIQAEAGESRLEQQTETPRREPLHYRIHGREQAADRYRSGEPLRGSLVLIHGFTEAGRRDPRLVDFASSLARVGFDVLVPELPGLTTMAIGTSEIDDIATALRFATREDTFTGVAAISYAAGSALIAAMEPDVSGQVAYMLVLGGYYDLVDAIRYATTGVDAGSGRMEPDREPMQEGKWMLLRAQLHHLDRPTDRAALEVIAERRMIDENAVVRDLLEELSPAGEAVYRLITNQDPDRVEALLLDLPASVQEEIAALDLARRDLSTLQAKLLLIHGRDDRVIPLSHSERLAATLPPEQAELFVAGGLDHVDVSPGIWDSFQLWRATWALLAVADQHAR